MNGVMIDLFVFNLVVTVTVLLILVATLIDGHIHR